MLGPQWPPESAVPESYTTAAAEELADFAVAYGQSPDPWQSNVLEIGCGELADGTWAAQEVAVLVQRQNGKGGVFETRGLGGLYLLGERHLIYTAHLIDTAKMAFKRCVELVTNYDDLRRRTRHVNKTNSEEAIEHVSGAELQFRTRGRGAGKGRGFSCDTLFIDEALYLQQAALDALGPTMLARPNPQIWYLSTPAETHDAPLLRIRDDGLAGVPGMAMAMWRNPAGADLGDEKVLANGNPAWGIRLNLGVMKVLRRRLGEQGFARECGGLWPEPAGQRWQVISEAAWLASQSARLKLEDPVALGVDVTPDRTWSAVAASGRLAVGGRGVEVLEHRPGTTWVIPRLKQLADKHGPCVVVTSDRAIADAAEEAELVVYRAGSGDLASAASMTYDGVAGTAPDVHHLPDVDLTEAVAGATKRQLGDGWAWDRRSVSVNICPLVACSLALWGLATPRVWPRRRAAAVASVDTGPAPAKPAEVGEDANAARIREQIERDMVGSR